MFGKRLRELRKENNLLQEDLSKVLNITPSAVGMYENNKRQPSYEILEKLAGYFNVSTDYLMGLTNIKQPAKLQWTWEEIQEIAPDEIKEYFSEKHMKRIDFVKELEKEEISVDILKELVEVYKKINKK